MRPTGDGFYLRSNWKKKRIGNMFRSSGILLALDHGTTMTWMLILFTVFFGFSYGGIGTNFPAIVGDYFGRLKAASIIGFMFTFAGSAAAFGPIMGGYIYDLTGSYHFAFLLGGLTNLLSLILIFISTPPKQKLTHKG